MAEYLTNVPGTRFGIKEVADVHFYEIEPTVKNIDEALRFYTVERQPVITFDTLKVSNIESTAENSEARGGKGNAALISWDYGREITVNLEDALLSMETLSLLFEDSVNADGTIIIDANKFPGTYAVIGTTYARNESTGKDDVFKFIIPKAKIQSETTLTMEAEGDPTVIGMTLKVLRTKSGEMMGLVLDGYTSTATDAVHYVTFVTDSTTTTKKVTGNATTWASVKVSPATGKAWSPAYPASGNVDKSATFVEVDAED